MSSTREVAGKTQGEIAAVVEMTQGQLSRLEHRDDHLVSTLRRYVEALGGELEVVARFNDRTVRLRGV
jgi:transcriptional regulator with XRE-family HTH domain